MLLSLLACVASCAMIPIGHGHVLRKRDAADACDTEDCDHYAQTILNGLDQSVDPCDDFYNYVCGSWSIHNPIPHNEIIWSVFSLTKKLTNERLRDIMSEPINPGSPEPVKKAQRFYRSCMDTERIERKGIQPFLEILNERGGWPIAMPKDSWDMADESWFGLDTSYFNLSGDLSVVNINYAPDDDNSSRFVISIDQARSYPFGDKYKNLKSASTRSIYLDVITKTAKIFAEANGHVSSKQILEDATDMIFFEQLLQNLTLKEDETYREGTDRIKMSIGELQEMYDSFGDFTHLDEFQVDWLYMIRQVFRGVANMQITEDTQVYVNCKYCLHKMAIILSGTPKRIIANYIHWTFLSSHMQYGNQQLRDIRFDMMYANYEGISSKPRWEDCIDELPLRDGMGILFVQRYIRPEVVKNAVDMTNRVRDELKKDVKNVAWANDDMKQHMTDKLDHLNEEIAYPDWYKNETAVNQLYKNVDIGPDYLENACNYNSEETRRQLNFFTTGYPQDEWLDFPVTVNAFYYGPANTIILPAAQIQEPYFVKDMPNAVNYGFMGFVVGHEVGHGLDNNGIHYDKSGNRVTAGLKELLEHYEQRAQCFVDQFSNYTLDETDAEGNPLHLNGALTQGENIADTLGIQVAYDAFRLKQQSDTNTPATLKKLPNIDADKLFFISFAAGWCHDERKGNEPEDYNDVHSPANLRVIGALSNSRQFAKVFQCPVGSRMNPVRKCTLWK